jgi:hypothetical protein
MKPNEEFLNQDKSFWAFVRTISEEVGYTVHGEDKIKVPTLVEAADALMSLKLDASSIREHDRPTELGRKLLDYLAYRAAAIGDIRDHLLNATEAEQMFKEVKRRCSHVCHLPMNKQKGEKKTHAYLTCVVTMLLEETLEGLTPLKTLPVPEADASEARKNWLERRQVDEVLRPKKYVDKLIVDGQIRNGRRDRRSVFHPGDVQRLLPHCDYDPRTLTTVTVAGRPLRTLARRVDGAYPRPVNPIAIWEIKEYNHTTTFGSRVADGIYETLLDGAELEDLLLEGHKVRHYLFVDGYRTWWEDGKSYLCRIVDSMHSVLSVSRPNRTLGQIRLWGVCISLR